MDIRKGTRAGVVLLAFGAALLALGCGGRQSVASRSAAAYRAAVATGTPGGGSGHGRQAAETEATASGGGGHDNMTGRDQSRMPEMDHGPMKGMGHPRMQHESMPAMAGMPGMQHESMQHGSTASMPGMQHAATAVAPVPPAPTNSAGIARLDPSATLRPDAFDEPAPAAVAEANKAGVSGGHAKQEPGSALPKPPDHSHDGGNPNGGMKERR